MIKHIREKLVARIGSISGGASILGSWQVCHNVCLGLIALLAAIGITVVGMPLEFLTKIAVPLWSIAFILLIITLWFFIKMKCISSRLILLNIGLVTAGVPFQFAQPFIKIFWVIGGLIALTGIALFVKDKLKGKGKMKKRKIIILSILLVGFLVIIYAIMGLWISINSVSVADTNQKASSINQETFDSVLIGTTGNGDVAIELKPKSVSNGQLIVDISINTHSVDLSQFNLKQITTLEYNGKTISPSQAPSLSGHHVFGDLVFDIDENIDVFSIKIKSIPLIKERVFEWR